MGIFNEKIPSQKSAILTFIEQQKTLAEIADQLDSEMHNPYAPAPLPLQSVYEIPRKKSWMDAITQFQIETEQNLRDSKEIDEKIEKLHDMVETVDKINYFADVPDDEKKKEAIKKNSQSFLSSKRVHQLASGDSSAGKPKAPKKPVIRPQESSNKVKPKSSAPKKASKETLPLTRASSSTMSLPAKFHRTPPPRNVKISESVRKLLDDVKEKRENKSQKKTPVNVINLKLN